MSSDDRNERLANLIADLYASDDQFAAARPDVTIAAQMAQPTLRLIELVQIVMKGYAQRPALAQRAARHVTDPTTGRVSLELLARFESITYEELWNRASRLATTLACGPDPAVRPRDRVCLLGFASIDYAIVELALIQRGAVSVPLQTGAQVTQLAAVVAETEPTVIATSVVDLADAVELVTNSSARQLIVFDFHPDVDDHRDAVEAARARLAEAGIEKMLHTLPDELDHANAEPAPIFVPDDDPLTLLIYTSGSTGTPKGARYPERLVSNLWRGAIVATLAQDCPPPSITLTFMPMSHGGGRALLYGTLGNGGTAYFVGKRDLSTLLEDLALVRPTQLSFVPRIWEMLYHKFRTAVERRSSGQADTADIESAALKEMREKILGGRFTTAITGSAPVSSEVKEFAEALLDIDLIDGYGATETGPVMLDGYIRRPPVIDYKLMDVPELGYFRTDRPYPRGELLVKSTILFDGYYKQPEATAEAFDAEGFYRTGDVMAQIGPDQFAYVDRRHNVLKLAQGEFVTISKLEALYVNSALVQQIYVYGNSAQSYLLAVVVPTEEAIFRYNADELTRLIGISLRNTAKAAGLQPYEIPRDFIVEPTPFTIEEGLLTGIGKLARPRLKARYGDQLESMYEELAQRQQDELRALRDGAAERPILETVCRVASAVLGIDADGVSGDAQFTGLGGDSLSALSFANLLRDVFGADVPVGVIVSPATSIGAIADVIRSAQNCSAARPTAASVHGLDITEVWARDLTLDKFIDAQTLTAAMTLTPPGGEIRTVLLTGATGFLGRYLLLEWLERLEAVDGTLICLVRATDNAAARKRLDEIFDSGDATLLQRYQTLAAKHLDVIAGDKSEVDFGLDPSTWQRLADTVDLIIDPAALVNHVLPYQHLFGPNVVGTAELIRLALTTKLKPFAYVSTIGVVVGIAPDAPTEQADIRAISSTRPVGEGYANGYANSKWAGEVLLREAHQLCGLPVTVFRCDMILAEPKYVGQLNVPDVVTRWVLSLVATGLAPQSFYLTDQDGRRQRAHFDGLPVDFVADAISTLGAKTIAGFHTYNVSNPHDDGIGLDEFVDWLIDANYPIQRISDYAEWLHRFETALRSLPEHQRQASLLPLLHNYERPYVPLRGALAPTARFRTAVQNAKVGSENDIPHVSAEMIVKYATDLQRLGLLCTAESNRCSTTLR
ncbi:carboxylic acid reductase [Mycolicibacterium sp. CBMA 226]|uniref:carboxylic acid reductase n=1 Tax=Mycolicibacterium sp. CBMA 226 TaxID=2606611 RepID=UPI0012DE8CE5|nr:carboxylic acid reductase [Mycolicibacterium sp. CBMA 226]MUL78726.1 carboxylic acid reductase [Mycolicibacterium sp. CBMA 226]